MQQRIYLGIDDTDTLNSDRGTGKLARGLVGSIPDDIRCCGVVRQQLLIHPEVPYTSHNSAACLILEPSGRSGIESVVDCAVQYVERHYLVGSDPGLCVAEADKASCERLNDFGLACTRRLVTQEEARAAANGVHLSGHGGSNDGIIGAAAAVGLTASGWSGRYIEYGRLRSLPETMKVSELETMGVRVVSLDRNAVLPASGDTVSTNCWVRPRLIGNRPVLLVLPDGEGRWLNIGSKRKKTHAGGGPSGGWSN
jgi:tRNA(Ile2) C34 agmatinyltransferase TiaS